MKTTITLSVLILGLSFCLQAEKPKKENNLLGYWKLVKAETNGKPNPANMMDRTFEYTNDGIFEGKIFFNGEEQPFNRGKYFLANDSTIICIHSSPDDKLSLVSYTYNFHVKNDSLHLYGIYFSGVQDKPNLLQMNYINEWWVKPTALYKKEKQ
ncbi:MAG TPA: hypothetical protein VFG54_09525 [Prolixibacteraceae bacterium]|nr:hypothetical protein [Prolixibacteraceae bacterium]